MRNYLHCIYLASIILMLSSCGTNRYIQNCDIKIQGSPNADYYALHQQSFSSKDGFKSMLEREDKISIGCKGGIKFLGSGDENGTVNIKINTESHNRSKGIYVLKSGYEPQKIKLRKTFNWATLINVVFPPNFFFDHYRVISKKKVNNLKLKEESSMSAVELFEMALAEDNIKDQIKLYKHAFAQDYHNEMGVGVKSLNNIALLYASNKDVHEAYLLLKFASKYNTEDVEHNLIWLKNIAMQLNNEKHVKDEKFHRTMDALQGIGNALQTAGSAVASYQSQSSSSSNNYQSNYAAPKVSTNSSSYSGGSSQSYYQTQYDRWESVAERHYNTIKQTGISTQRKKLYNEAQDEMKKIRQQAAKDGFTIVQSSWERINL